MREKDFRRTYSTRKVETATSQHVGNSGFETIWDAVRIGAAISACIEGGSAAWEASGSPYGAAAGCLAGAVALDQGAERAKKKIKGQGP